MKLSSRPATGRATDEPTDQPSQIRRAEPLPTPPGPVPQLPSVTKTLPPHLYKCGGSPRAGSGKTADKACHLKPLLEIARLFTLKGAPLIGKKNVKSRKDHFIHRPESRHRAIKRGRATDEPTDPRQELQTEGQTTRARTNSAETKAKHQLIPPAKVACPHLVTVWRWAKYDPWLPLMNPKSPSCVAGKSSGPAWTSSPFAKSLVGSARGTR